jgi:hypothetical protein
MVDNSSTRNLTKMIKRGAIVLALLLRVMLFHSPSAEGADFTHCKFERPCILVSGEIVPGDKARLVAAFEKHIDPYIKITGYAPFFGNEPAAFPEVFLNSDGGDVKTAMEMGRVIREKRGWVWVDNDSRCVSSCVLLVAAGAMRMIHGRVGIHRPYSLSLEEQSAEAEQTKYAQIGDQVRAYFKDMNVATYLYDAMVRIPPESVRWLDKGELESFGILELDPVESALEDVKAARHYGINKQELLRRRAAVDLNCGPATGMSMEEARAYSRCQREIMEGQRR